MMAVHRAERSAASPGFAVVYEPPVSRRCDRQAGRLTGLSTTAQRLSTSLCSGCPHPPAMWLRQVCWEAAPSLPDGSPARSPSDEPSMVPFSGLARAPVHDDFDASSASAYSGTAACHGGSI